MQASSELPHHPATSLFPMMDEQALAELAADIKEHGLIEPVVVFRGELLDGRNRIEACKRVGVAVKEREWEPDGHTPVSWIISTNLHRRHLSTSQRAVIGVEALPMLEAEARERQANTQFPRSASFGANRKVKGRAAEKAGAMVGVSSMSIQRAKRLKKQHPAAFEEVKAGKTTIGAAFTAAGLTWRSGPRPRLPDLSNSRNLMIAKATQDKFARGVTSVEAAARILTELNYEFIVAAADQPQIEEWNKRLIKSESHIRQSRKALKEVQDAATEHTNGATQGGGVEDPPDGTAPTGKGASREHQGRP